MSDPTKSSLPAPCQRLLEELQRLNFGRILGLEVRNGLPVLDGPLRVIRDVKFAAESRPRPELAREDFVLKAQVIDFFHQLSELGDATIHCLEVQHGLPFRMQVEEEVFA